jgi:hypothetical protein
MNPQDPADPPIGPGMTPGTPPADAPVADVVPPGPTGPPTAPAAPSGGQPAWTWGWDQDPRRAARRAERDARRAARRAERGFRGAIWGVVLVLIGLAILASELVPGFDWNVAWPAFLVAIGVLLMLASIRRPPAAA